MSRMAGPSVLRLSSTLVLLAWLSCAHASLGDEAASIISDAAQLNGVVQPEAGSALNPVVISVDNGISVHEYVDASGRVFAVAWSGPAVPDLRILLGTYYPAYTSGLASLVNPGRQRAVQVIAANLVVRTAGHLRAYSGLAYLKDRLPSSTTLESLR